MDRRRDGTAAPVCVRHPIDQGGVIAVQTLSLPKTADALDDVCRGLFRSPLQVFALGHQRIWVDSERSSRTEPGDASPSSWAGLDDHHESALGPATAAILAACWASTHIQYSPSSSLPNRYGRLPLCAAAVTA